MTPAAGHFEPEEKRSLLEVQQVQQGLWILEMNWLLVWMIYSALVLESQKGFQ